MLSALLRLSIEADQIIILPDGEAIAHLTPLVPGVIDLAPLGAVIVAAVEIEIKTVITAISLATTPRIAPLDPFALTVGLRTINLGTAHRKKWINRLRHHHHTNLALTPAELPMIPPDLNISLLTLMRTQHL